MCTYFDKRYSIVKTTPTPGSRHRSWQDMDQFQFDGGGEVVSAWRKESEERDIHSRIAKGHRCIHLVESLPYVISSFRVNADRISWKHCFGTC